MSTARWLLGRQWRSRVGRWSLIVCVVAVTVTPIISVAVAQHSAEAASLELGRALGGPAPLRVVGSTIKGGLTPTVVAQLRTLPEMATVVPMTQAITAADGTTRPVLVLGVDCSAEAVLGDFGCSEATYADDHAPVVVAPTLLRAMPEDGALRSTSGGVERSQLVSSGRLSSVNDGYVALTGAPRARQMFGRAENADVAYLLPSAGASVGTIRDEIHRMGGPELRVLSPDDPPPGPDVAGQVSALLGVVGLFGLVVGWLLVRNITRIALAARGREMAIAVAVGRPPSAIAFEFGIEATMLGLAGAALGCAGGLGGGSVLVGSIRDLVSSFTGTTVAVLFPWWAAAGALIISLAMVLAATLPEARRAGHVDVTRMLPAQQAGEEPKPPPSRASSLVMVGLLTGSIVGCRMLVGETGLSVWGQPLAVLLLLGAVASGFGVAAATAPLALEAAARITRRLPRFALLARSVAGGGRRVSSVSLAVTFSVALATALGGLVPAMRSSAFDYTARNVGSRLALNTLPFNDSALVDAKIGPDLVAEIGRVSGAAASRETWVLTRARPGIETAVMASDHPSFGFPILSGRPAETVFRSGDCVIGAPLARSLGIGVGERLVLDAPDGPAPITVGAVSENINNVGFVAVVPASFMTTHWGWQPPDPLLVGRTDGSTLTGAERARIASLDPHLRVETASQLADETADSIVAYMGPFEMLRDILLGVVAMASFTALALVAVQRRREFALLQAVGLAPDQLRGVAITEAALVAVVGAVQGVVLGILLAEPLRDAASFVVGIRPPLRIGLIASGAACVSAVAASVIASIGPARRLRRLDVSAALRGD